MQAFIDDEVRGYATHPSKRWANEVEPAPSWASTTKRKLSETTQPPVVPKESNRAIAEHKRAESFEAMCEAQAESLAKAKAVVAQLKADASSLAEENCILRGLLAEAEKANELLSAQCAALVESQNVEGTRPLRYTDLYPGGALASRVGLFTFFDTVELNDAFLDAINLKPRCSSGLGFSFRISKWVS